jgi:mannosylglycoprotein endo-beta-mannosidase
MIVCSFNVRGLGSRVKRKKIADLVRSEKIEFLALQETKLEVISDTLVHYLWGNSDCCWAFVPSVGSSGGILSIWRKQYSSLLFTVLGE